MIDQVDQRLEQWIREVLDGVTVSLAAPGAEDSGVGLYLLDVAPALPERRTARPVPKIILSYLITTFHNDPAEAHRMLGELIFAAMEHTEYDVAQEPIPTAIWTAFGAVPMPAFLLRVPLRRPRPEEPVEPVRRIEVSASPVAALYGRVVGPGDVALSGARVDVQGLGFYTHTDSQGRFRFSAIPGQAWKKRLRVLAKGRVQEVAVEEVTTPEDPVIIRFDDLD